MVAFSLACAGHAKPPNANPNVSGVRYFQGFITGSLGTVNRASKPESINSPGPEGRNPHATVDSNRPVQFVPGADRDPRASFIFRRGRSR